MRKRTGIWVVPVVLAAAGLVSAPHPVSAATGSDVIYTTSADFEHGTVGNVNYDSPSNQLQLTTKSGTFPFIWVSLSQRCTIAVINTVTGTVLGEYRTISDGTSCSESSRTSVGLDGSVWVGHRGVTGQVTHVGLMELNQCVDRNGNGTIDTSTGYGDVRAWAGVQSTVSAAQDECILHHIDTGGADSRHMSIDREGNLWVGDRNGGSVFRKYATTTGALLAGPFDWDCGGYGGLIDRSGVIWSATQTGAVLRWDPNAPIVSPNGPNPDSNPRCIDIVNYGLALDAQGNVWVSTVDRGYVSKISPDGVTITQFAQGNLNAQGLAVDGQGDVWISSSLRCTANCKVGHLRNDGSFVGFVDLPTGVGQTGVAVDAAGKIWITNYLSNNATRIDPTLNGGIGGPDLTVEFPATPGRPLPFPYNYSDMTGAQLLNTTAPQGSWTVSQDSGTTGNSWESITWNSEPQGTVPPGASITVEARTAETEVGLGSSSYSAVTSGAALTMSGRFIQVRVTLTRAAGGANPILSDIRVKSRPSAIPGPPGPPGPPGTPGTPTPPGGPTPAARFVSLVPARLLETRDGLSTVDGQFNAIGVRTTGTVTELPIAGRAGVPVDAKAVVINLAVAGSTQPGFVTIFPCGTPRPNASSINYAAGQTISNAVTARIGDAGKICIFTFSDTHVIIDVTGAFPSRSQFVALVPGRVMETRDGLSTVDGQFNAIGVRTTGTVTELPITGRVGVPAGADAVVVNLAVTGSTQPGFVTIFPCGTPRPNVSSINYAAGQTISNAVTARIGDAGKICIFTFSDTHVIIDVTGAHPSDSGFASLVPARVLETRDGYATADGQSNAIGLRTTGTVTELPITGRVGVPAGADAVVVNLAVTGSTQPGFVTIFPCGAPRPNASSINYAAGQTISNAVTARIGDAGKICIFTFSDTHVIVDVTGAYA